jgi:hypothetical protein
MLFPERPITVEHIKAFCETVTEGLRVEYKTPFDDSVRGKIAKVVSSFANSNGGVLVVGVQTAKGVPQPPFEGFVPPSKEELRLTVQNLCLKNIHAPLIPNVTVVPSDVPSHVFLVIEVDESAQAPHAIENSKTVYVRTGDASNPYELANVDLILDLVKRRNEPARLRQALIDNARERGKDESSSSVPRMEIVISPRFPRTALCPPGETVDFLKLVQMNPSFTFLLPYNSLIRLPDGAGSIMFSEETRARQYFELNRYGLLYTRRVFNKRPWSTPSDVLQQLAFGNLLHALMQMTTCARRFFEEKFRGELVVSVVLESVLNQIMRFRDPTPPMYDMSSSDDYKCHSNLVHVSRDVSTEELKDRQMDVVGSILTELTWAFWQGNDEHPTQPLLEYLTRFKF